MKQWWSKVKGWFGEGVSLGLAVEKAGARPVGPRLLVKPVLIAEQTKGGIVIPKGVARADAMLQIQADVIAVGKTCWKGEEPWCEVGDRVVIARSCGLLWDSDGENEGDYRFISHLDVVGVVILKMGVEGEGNE